MKEASAASQASLYALVARQAELTPNATALHEQSGDMSWTYSELIAMVKSLAAKLRPVVQRNQQQVELPITPLVCILMERNHLHIVAILAVLSIGAAYVPIDPSFPEDRQQYIMQHSRCSVVVIEPKFAKKVESMTHSLASDAAEVLIVDAISLSQQYTGHVAVGHDQTVSASSTSSTQLAYVLYTSGSTGKPKGVMVRDSSVVNLVQFFATELRVTPTDRVLGLTTFCFDISVLEVFLPLISGATLVLAASATQKNPLALISLLAAQRVSILQATPTTYEMLLASGWSGDMQITALVGGEACRPSVAELAGRVKQLMNVYGPTETTIWSSSHSLSPDPAQQLAYKEGHVPVGKPLWGTTFHLVDEQGKEVIGEGEGELWIGGDGVALGYLHSPELTASKFVPNPFDCAYKGMPAYRTGDLFQRSADGLYFFLRRLDDQVKVAGYRIELGEVERACQQHPRVNQALAVAKQDLLVVFVTLHKEDGISGISLSEHQLRKEVRAAAATKVPPYMLPSVVKALDAIPTTANGKLDRLAVTVLLEQYLLQEQSIGHLELEVDKEDQKIMDGDDNGRQHADHDTVNARTKASLSMVGFIVSTAERASGQPIPSLHASFAALGIDSLAAVLFRRSLAQAIGDGFDVDARLLYDPDTTVLSFSRAVYDRLNAEQPETLMRLGITSATEVEEDDTAGLQAMEEGRSKLEQKSEASEESVQAMVIGQLILGKRELLEGLRGLVVALIIVDHFFISTKLAMRITADTSYFVILTGWITALQEASSPVTNTVKGWKPLAFLHSRFLGLFPIYWLVLLLCGPYIYCSLPNQHLTQSQLGGVLTLYVLGLQEWTQYCNTSLRAVYYVSVIWGVLCVYAAMKTTWIWSSKMHYVFRVLLQGCWVAFLLGMEVYLWNYGGLHCPWAMLYFYGAFGIAKYVLIPLLQLCGNVSAPTAEAATVVGTPTSAWKYYVPAVLTDATCVVLLFTTFFNGFDGSQGAYSTFNSIARLYLNPFLFAMLVLFAFLQPAHHQQQGNYQSLLTRLLTCSYSGMRLLGECSLPIYLVQLTFVDFYFRLMIEGIADGDFPFTRRFIYHDRGDSSSTSSSPSSPPHYFLGYKIIAVALAVLLGIFLQKVYQDKLVVNLHLRLMAHFRQQQPLEQKAKGVSSC